MKFKEWIELQKARTKKYDSSIWIPLYESTIKKTGELFHVDYTEEVCLIKSILINKSDFDKANTLNWDRVGLCKAKSVVENGKYIPCDVLDKEFYDVDGILPVLVQQHGHCLPEIWELHQDIVIALKLYRDGDVWICPDEDYIEVAHLLRDEKGNPRRLDIRNEFLKDYLCARSMGLVLVWYQEHDKYVAKKPDFSWASEHEIITFGNGRWEGRIEKTTTTGNPVGSEAFVMHVSRTDLDKDDDIPVLGTPNDDNLSSESTIVPLETGTTIYRVTGEIWNNELILPGHISTRVRGDDPQNFPFFKIDAAGNEKTANQLSADGRWLWFNPEVINVLLEKKDGSLKWFTRETGEISCSYGFFVPFGINEEGFITVYAEDISILPVWQQIIWSGFNISPEGGVSRELLMAQVDAEPASTKAPEAFLSREYKRLNKLFISSFGIPLFRNQKEVEELFPKIHRFRSLSEDGFYSLAKDLARITADAIYTKEIQKQLINLSEEKWGSLKTLQYFLIQKLGAEEEKAKKLMAPLFGIYEMRQVDAHLKDATKDDSLTKLGISQELPPLFRGEAMLDKFVKTLCVIQSILTFKK